MHLGLLILPSKAGLSNSLTLGCHISLAYTEPESKRWNCHMVNVKMQVIWFITKTQQKKINILGDNLKIRRTGLIDHVKRPDIRVWQDDLQHASYLILHLPFCHLANPPSPALRPPHFSSSKCRSAAFLWCTKVGSSGKATQLRYCLVLNAFPSKIIGWENSLCCSLVRDELTVCIKVIVACLLFLDWLFLWPPSPPGRCDQVEGRFFNGPWVMGTVQLHRMFPHDRDD